MQEDFPELENKKVVCLLEVIGRFSEPCRTIVAGCNYHVGITLVNELDTEDEVVCLNRKQFLTELSRKHGMTEEIYSNMFHYIVEGIHKGVVNGRTLNSFIPWYEINVAKGVADCPFK